MEVTALVLSEQRRQKAELRDMEQIDKMRWLIQVSPGW